MACTIGIALASASCVVLAGVVVWVYGVRGGTAVTRRVSAPLLVSTLLGGAVGLAIFRFKGC